MSEKVIASLVGEVKFRVDSKPLQMFERVLDRVAAKMRALEKGVRPKIAPSGGGGGKAGAAAAGATSYKAAAVQSGIVYQNEAQRLKLAKAQAQLAAVQQSAAIRNQGMLAKIDQTAQQANLKAAQLQQKFETSKLGTIAQQARASTAAHRSKVAEVALERANLRLQAQKLAMQNRLQKGSGGLMGKIKGAMSGKASAGAVGGAMASGASFAGAEAGLSMFAGRLGLATGAVAGLGAAAVGAIAGLKAFGDRSASAGSQGRISQSQFNAVEGVTPEQAQAARARMQGMADNLGLSEAGISKEYSRSLIGLTDGGMKLDQGQDFLEGMLSYGKGSDLSSDRMSLVLSAVNQAMSKGQLYSEEWRQQISESLPGSNKLGAETWAEVSGKKGLKGEEAARNFADAMKNGEIAGDKLVQFFDQLGKRLNEEANRGGRLDAAKASPESIQNRIDNINTRNLEKAANHADKELLKSYERLGDSRQTFARRLEALSKAAAPMSADVNDNYAAFLNGAGYLAEGIGNSIQDIQKKIKELEASEGAANWDGANQQLEILTDRLGIAFDGTGDQLENLFARIGYFADKFPIAFVENTAREINNIIDFFNKAFSLLGRFADWLYNLPMSIVDKVRSAMQALGAKLETIGNEGTGLDFKSLQNRDVNPGARKPEDFAKDTAQRMRDQGQQTFNSNANVSINAPISINGANADPNAIAESVRSKLVGSIQSEMKGVFDMSLSNMLSRSRAGAVPAH